MESENVLDPEGRAEWREWLNRNHDREKEIWLIIHKKHTDAKGVNLEEAVEEAICFGWIDSKMKRINDETFILKFSLRNTDSLWSKINRERAMKLIDSGKMTASGLEKIEIAKKNGKWDSAYTSLVKLEIPADLKSALIQNENAWEHFHKFANTYQNMYIMYVQSAKKQETREKRIKKVVEQAMKNKKLITDTSN